MASDLKSQLTLPARAGLLVAVVLLLIPLAAWVEDTAPSVWQERLALPNLIEEPDRHTPIYTDGTYLPPRITVDTTYTSADNPLILTGITEVAAGATLTLEPGTKLVAHEFAALDIAGTLAARGTEEQPITLTTNEEHTANQLWGGLIFHDTGRGNIERAEIAHAAPGVSCLAGSRVAIAATRIHSTNTGLYTESAACTINSSRIQSLQYGIITRGGANVSNDTIISAAHEPVKHIEE